MLLRTILISTIVIALIYSLVTYSIEPKYFYEWLTVLISVCISSILAIAGGIYLYNHQKLLITCEKREEILRLLKTDFEDIKAIFDSKDLLNLKLKSGNYSVLITTLSEVITNKAIDSGLFNIDETLELLNFSRNLRLYNFKTNYIMGLLENSRQVEDAYFVNAVRNIETSKETILVLIGVISIKFNLE